jgi:hypothetical protein
MPYSDKQKRALGAVAGGDWKPRQGQPFHGVSSKEARLMLREGASPDVADVHKAMLKRHRKKGR